MIEINNQIIMSDVNDILLELKSELEINGIKRFNKFINTTNNIQTNCPFHKDGQEKKPSFGISKIDGACHCFGCGWSGTLSEMVSNCFGYDDFGNYGNKWIIKNFLTVAVENRQPLELDFCRNTNYKVSNKNTSAFEYVSDAELDEYREYHTYMWKRKLTPEIVEIFDIGYDKHTECITFPIRDIKGRTLFVARRSVNTKFFNYPTSVEKPVYGLYEYSKAMQQINTQTYSVGGWKDYLLGSEIIICESMIDALTCWVYGKPAVALNGLGNELQFEQLNNMPVRKFILATDMDEAGLRARERIKSKLKSKIVTEYRWDINVAKDINDMSKEYFRSLVEYF